MGNGAGSYIAIEVGRRGRWFAGEAQPGQVPEPAAAKRCGARETALVALACLQ